MGKGGFKGGHGYGGGGVNMNMVRQAQKMQQDLLKLQAEAEDKEYTAAAGGGMVKATVTGKKVLKSLEIAPDVVDPDDIEMLSDMIIAAVNEAMREADLSMSSDMSRITGGMNLGF